MRGHARLGVALLLASGIVIAGCDGGSPSQPASPSAITAPVSDARPAVKSPAADPAPAGPDDASDTGVSTSSSPASAAATDEPAPSVQWRTPEPVIDHPEEFVGPQFVPGGGTQPDAFAARTSATGANDLALPSAVYAPTLLPPVVSGDSVTVTWVPAAGGDQPREWRLIWSTPSQAGAFVFPVGTTTARGDGVWPGNYSVVVCAVNNAGSYLDTCSAVGTFTITPQYPNPPTNLRYETASNGTTVTLRWNPPSSGPAVDEYVILYQGQRIPVGRNLSVTADLAPGSYLVGVLSRNRSGESAAATITIQVVQRAGSYAGPFRTTGTITRYFTDGRCSWSIIYAGNIYVTLTTQSNGSVSGQVRVNGTWSATLTSQSRPCTSASGRYDSTVSLSGTRSYFSGSGLNIDLSTGAFGGNVSGTAVSGSLTIDYRHGTGTATWWGTLPGA
jgi:hypothetical protein